MGSKIVVLTGMLAIFCLGILYFVYQDPSLVNPPTGTGLPTISVGGTAVRVMLARTQAEQTLGLGGRSTLAPNQGMLFVFKTDGDYKIWMKDMQFPIDIVWIASSGAITHIEQNVSPRTYTDRPTPQIFGSPTPSRYVLEVPAGFVEQNNISTSDHVDL